MRPMISYAIEASYDLVLELASDHNKGHSEEETSEQNDKYTSKEDNLSTRTKMLFHCS